MSTIPKISKGRALGEILLILIIFVFGGGFVGLSFYLFDVGFSLENLQRALTPEGQKDLILPGILATPVGTLITLVAVYFMQKSRGERFADLGLKKPVSWGWTLRLGLGIAILLYALTFGVLFLLDQLGYTSTTDDFLFIKDGVWIFIFTMTAISWFSAAFGEEVIFRGLFLRNLTVLTGDSGVGIWIAIILQAAIFGSLHLNQDIGGGIAIFILAVALGAIFVKTGRNLWPVIIAHGIFDNIQFALLYYSPEIPA